MQLSTRTILGKWHSSIISFC